MRVSKLPEQLPSRDLGDDASELIDLGYKDAEARREDLLRFFAES